MIFRYLYAIVLLFLVTTACDNSQRKLKLINGAWEGVLLTEKGDSVPIDPKVLGFTFDQENKTYSYQSTLNYKEAGTFYIQTKYLFTRDTLHTTAEEKGVEIMQLSADSLHIKMMDNGKERLMKLRKLN